MRHPGSLVLAPLLAFAAAAGEIGCGRHAADCDLGLTCPAYAYTDAPDPACLVPPMLAEGGPIARCGVFAAPGASGGDGSRAAPFGSLQDAIDAAAAAGKPVYACAKEFTERIDVPSGAAIYGGLDCDHGWAWAAGQRTRVLAPASATAAGASEIAARLRAGDGKTILADLDVTAPDGLLAGVSSIAVLVEDTEAEITRSTLTAGDGRDGESGAHAGDDPALDGAQGTQGFGICAGGGTNPAPEAPAKACGAGVSTGGRGGDGGPPTGADIDGAAGGDGQPQYPTSPAAGLGGAGQSAASCEGGGQGADGDAGESGGGAVGSGGVSVDGYSGASGADGADGKPGQGGGGGGGAKGKTLVQCAGAPTIDRAGATGGSGGTGGCGGVGGGGGKAGGSSVALSSLATKAVSLTDVALSVGAGGNGGDGGDGQNGGSGGFGQVGGQGTIGAANGCHGGDGGRGGAGGPGGGGQGGHAIGVAYSGLAPQGTPEVGYKGAAASPGKGGAPGANSTAPMGHGADGISGDFVDFTAP